MTWQQILVALGGILGGMLGGILAASIGVRYQMRRDRDRHHKEMIEAVNEMAERLRRAQEDAAKDLYAKISGQRRELQREGREVLDRTARIEGQISGVSRTLHIIQERYMGASK